MKLFYSLSTSLVVLIMTSTIASAASPYGNWLRPKNGAHVKIYKCKGGLGMRVTKSPTPSKVGKVIMCGAKQKSKNKWRGKILNLDDGKTYTGIVTLKNDKTIKLEGCVLGGLFCKSDTWKKLN